ncbi:tryptophan--tRNA ligase, partial [Aerococcus sp. L_4]
NNRYTGKKESPILTMPEFYAPKEGGRIMSLQEPTKKMSKSDENKKSFVSLLDDPKTITKKIKSAMTDSSGEIFYDKENKAGVSNLLTIYSSFANRPIDDIVVEYQGAGYGKFKQDLADVVISILEPMQERHAKLMASSELDDILADGAKKANEVANETLAAMEKAIGFR